MRTCETSAEIAKETLRAWKDGSVRAFEAIVRITMRRAFTVALGIVGNEEDARDLSQEAFMAAHRARATFDIERPFFPWFYRILRNRCLNFIRSRSGRREISADVLVEQPCAGESPEGRVIRRERAEAVWRAIIVLRTFQELSYREIADTLGISEGTVMSRLIYARKALYRLLKDVCDVSDGEGDDRQ